MNEINRSKGKYQYKTNMHILGVIEKVTILQKKLN